MFCRMSICFRHFVGSYFRGGECLVLTFSDVLNNTSGFSFPIGEDDLGNLVVSNFDHTPHLLIAGATGTGKSVFAHSIILSLLSHNDSSKLRLILCDTKLVEFCEYKEVSNLSIPICTDTKKIVGALEWTAYETKRRLRLLSSVNSKTLLSYNDYAWENFLDDLPHILVVVDDLTTVVSETSEAILNIQEILQNGRAVGVHLIAITQTPTLKPTKKLSLMFRHKVIFSFSSKTESSLLVGTSKDFGLDSCGCCLYADGVAIQKIKTIQPSPKIELEIIENRKQILSNQGEAEPQEIKNGMLDPTEETDEDELLPYAIDVVLEIGQASVSMVQRKLKLGYARAARLIDQMEKKGIIGPFEGSKPREILIDNKKSEEINQPIKNSENIESFQNIQRKSEDENNAQKTTKSRCGRRKRKCRLFGIPFKGKRME